MEKYIWENNTSSKALASILKWTPDQLGKSVFHDPLPNTELKPEHQAYGAAVKKVVEGMSVMQSRNYSLFIKFYERVQIFCIFLGESEESLEEYKKAALQVLIKQKRQNI